ncbi:Protein Z-dependent protease inhibitor [Thelohanellus kitauei]|uniref:Protein Z-dependent protease inhibitor n=1 Tax=Thelohanellus kitauei TaxID=669202 RepID=A0A0C2NM21_THEKT|nr:Protein Z-dependent protease inhibitor [Thelohanellus kitauei]
MLMSIFNVNQFGHAILNHLAQSQNNTGNIAFSGQSLYILISIINAGLGRRTQTILSRLIYFYAFELQSTTSWEDTVVGMILSRMDQEIRSMMTTKSAIFHTFQIRDRFVYGSKKLTDIEYHKCNSSNTEKMTRKINQWARKYTRGSVNNLYQHPLDKDTNMIVISTVYYFADWLVPFSPIKTKSEIFTDDTGEEFYVAMMEQFGSFKIYAAFNTNFSIIFIPMVKIGLYAAVVLPDLAHSIQETLANLKLKLPKFKITTKNRFINTLIHFNVSELFDSKKADFGFMTMENVSISDLMQLTTVVVDEFSTGDEIEDEPAGFGTVPVVEYFVDRPFLFLIYSTNSIDIPLSIVVTNPNDH